MTAARKPRSPEYIERKRVREKEKRRIAREAKGFASAAEFRKFAAGMTPQRAKEQVEQMLQSGKMNPQQFQQLQQQAKEFMRFLK